MTRKSKLPSSDDELVLPDGTRVKPSSSQPFARVEVPSNTEAARIVTSTRRKLVDMPALPKHMNSYAVVLCYTASGLSDTEISVATGFTAEQVLHLRSQSAYRDLEAMVTSAVKEQATASVKEILVSGEVTAAQKMVALAESDDDKIAIAAARDLLDRGGHKAAEKVNIHTRVDNTFRIEIVDKRENDAPVIDMETDT